MILLLIALLFLPSDAGRSNSFRVHISDPIRLKCDELPFRTAYIGSRCYFAVPNEVKYSEASTECHSKFPGSQLSTNAPFVVFSTMMLEKSKFHVKESSGAKQSLCSYDAAYKCDAGEQSTHTAEYYCSQLGMEVPTIDNELDNLMIRGAIKKYAWIRNFYDGASTKKWKRDNYFSKHTTCPRGQSSSPTALFAGAEMPLLCASPLASIIDKYGIWGIAQPKFVGPIGAVCVRNAENEFTGTGPKDSCFQLTDHVNRTWFMPLSNFPRETYRQFCLASAALTMNDNAVKLVVRRGCMFFGYAHPLYGTHPVQDTVTLSHRTYGDHIVPSHHNGAFPDWRIAISRVACWCDPTEATLNDHEPSPPKKNKCIEQHIFNETTQSCESIWEPKFCAELITNDGKRQQLEIPNWPTNRRYDELHFDNPKKREENFHRSVTDIVVRQHCWATLYSTANVAQRQTLASSGYGKHQVASSYNGLVNNLHDGTNRVVCECIR